MTSITSPSSSSLTLRAALRASHALTVPTTARSVAGAAPSVTSRWPSASGSMPRAPSGACSGRRAAHVVDVELQQLVAQAAGEAVDLLVGGVGPGVQAQRQLRSLRVSS